MTDDLFAPEVPFTIQGRASFNTFGYSVTLRQTIYDHEKGAALRQAKDRVRAASSEFEAARQELILQTAARYFATLAARDDVDLAQAEVEAARQRLHVTETRIQTGLDVTTAAYEATARVSLAEASESAARDRLDFALETLAETIGREVSDLAALREDAAPAVSGDRAHWVALALKGNLDLERERRNADVARHEVKRRRASILPHLDLVARRVFIDERGSIAGPRTERSDTDFFAQLTVSIISGGLNWTHAKAARYLSEAALQEVALQERVVRRKARTAHAAVVHSQARVRALGQAVSASASAVAEKETGAEVGLYTNLDVLDAQRELFRAKRELAHARYGSIMSVLELERVAGQLDREDLARVNAWLR